MILIVDDHADTAALLVRLLSRIGLEAAHVGSAADAFSYLRQRGPPLPSLILLDVSMPEVDGIGCLRTLRADPAWAGVPVVMHTADFSSDRRREAMRLGASEYMVKGLTELDEFYAIVRRHNRPPPQPAPFA